MAIILAQEKTGTIVFTHAPEGEPPWPIEDIYAMDEDGTNVRALTHDGHSHNPAWSPDGRHLLYVHDAALRTPMPNERSEFASHHPIELYVMDRNGAGSRLLWKSDLPIFSAAWSPDGRVLAMSTATQPPATPPDDEPRRSGLFLLPADGHSEPRLLFRDALTPAWSPDGKQLAFSKNRPRGQWAIHVAGADGTGDKELTDPPRMAGSPAWSPDGSWTAFDEFTDSQRQQVFVMQPDGSHRRQITTDSIWSCAHPTWSGDGKRLIASCRSAAVPCGGITSVGIREPGCTRRLFSIPAFEPNGRPVQLSDRDGFEPEFTPNR